MSRRAGGEFVRFVVVNGVNTLAYWGLYLALLVVLPYMAANTVSLAVAVVLAYWLNARFTFRVGLSGRALAGFVAGQGVTILLRTALVWLMVELAGLPEAFAPPVAVALAMPVAFAVTKLALSPAASPAASPVPAATPVPVPAGVVVPAQARP